MVVFGPSGRPIIPEAKIGGIPWRRENPASRHRQRGNEILADVIEDDAHRNRSFQVISRILENWNIALRPVVILVVCVGACISIYATTFHNFIPLVEPDRLDRGSDVIDEIGGESRVRVVVSRVGGRVVFRRIQLRKVLSRLQIIQAQRREVDKHHILHISGLEVGGAIVADSDLRV